MKRHPRVVAAVVVIAAITVVSACAPEEAPKPTPTAAFASDEEAFAAAEETYRAYVDALNESRNGGDIDPLSFLVGDALDAGIETEKLLSDQGKSISGETHLVEYEGVSFADDVISGHSCIDVSETRVVDADGSDQTPEDRPERVMLNVEILEVDGLLRITSSEAVELTC